MADNFVPKEARLTGFAVMQLVNITGSMIAAGDGGEVVNAVEPCLTCIVEDSN